MAELVMAIRRTSPGFTRGSSSFRGVTQHKSGAWPHLALPGPSLPNVVHVSDVQIECTRNTTSPYLHAPRCTCNGGLICRALFLSPLQGRPSSCPQLQLGAVQELDVPI